MTTTPDTCTAETWPYHAMLDLGWVVLGGGMALSVEAIGEEKPPGQSAVCWPTVRFGPVMMSRPPAPGESAPWFEVSVTGRRDHVTRSIGGCFASLEDARIVAALILKNSTAWDREGEPSRWADQGHPSRSRFIE